MEKPKVLSGEALVAKGITKTDASLPEIGLKDVTPNGSWLEQKQIQAALEARKYLIEVERIEKWGTLSHAEWCEDLKLAEVIQKAGGHWQYLGHNVGKKLYLQPEEALFLMEVNCLLLKHNEVTVSLQKAYSLLLDSSTTMIQYKVYASLSRLGYKIFRHKVPKRNNEKKTHTQKVCSEHDSENIDKSTISTENESENAYTLAVTTENESVNANKSAAVSTVIKSEYIDSPAVGTEDKSENGNTPAANIENESEIVNKPTVSIEIETVNTNTPAANIENVSRIVNSPAVSTENTPENDLPTISPVIQSEDKYFPETPFIVCHTQCDGFDPEIDKMLNKTKIAGPPKESQVNIVSENNDQEGNTYSEANTAKNNKDEDNNDKSGTQNDVDAAIKDESPIVMNVDEVSKLKNADNVGQSESLQEVSSSVTQSTTATETNNANKDEGNDVTNEKVDDKTDSMEICDGIMKARDSGIVLMEEDDDINKDSEAAAAEENNSMIIDVAVGPGAHSVEEVKNDTNKDQSVRSPATATILEVNSVIMDVAVDSGAQNIEDNTTFQEDSSKNNEPSSSNNSIAIENFISTFYNRQNNYLAYYNSTKIEKLTKRSLKPSDSRSIEKHFENIPDLFKKQVVTVNVPEQQFIPSNIYVNNSNYLLNLQNIKKRSRRTASTDSSSYTSADEVNGSNVRRIRSSSGTEFNNLTHNFFPQVRHHHFRPYGIWRPQNNLNFYQFSMYFQRPSFSNLYFQSRFQYLPRPTFLRSFTYPGNLNQNTLNVGLNARKRMRTGRDAHLQGIKNLAVRLKQFVMSGNTQMQDLETLHSNLHSYNLKYKSRLRLTEHFDVVNEEKILDTIELDDDDETKSKKPKLDPDDGDKFDENLYTLRQLALKLRDLESKDKATAGHRRAFSKAIKTFNESYNADIYLDDNNYEVIDRRCITLESSSESDCVVEEEPQLLKGRVKRLRNPFNILKRRSERLQSLNNPSTSKDDNASDPSRTEPDQAESEKYNIYTEHLLKTFDETWLPNEKDFGRAEIVPKRFMNSRLADSCKEQYLYDFMKDQFHDYQNWLEAKISFLRHLEETNIAFQNEQALILADSEIRNVGLRPLIDFEDSSDIAVENLSIIKYNKEVDTETSLSIDYDVYNRDVQNYRKSNPPKPHFRIICVDESSSFPSAAQVMALHSKYEDNVAIVFAIVGLSSISYLQINPIDLPRIKCKHNDVV